MAFETAPPFPLRARLRDLRSHAGAALRATARLALDGALPQLCISCRAPVSGDGLCAACWAGLSFIAPPYCARLGTPFAYDQGPDLISLEAIAHPPDYDRARAAVRYDDVARALVHGLKFHDRTDLAPAMGRWMAQAGRDLLREADALVPVPLHWRRFWSRRYNQSGALAQIVGKAYGVTVLHDALKRRRSTAQQIGLSRAERARNVQGAFKVARPADIAGRRVVVIDDVLTSGATANACARALRRGGAAQVDILVFARVVDSDRAPI